MNRICFHAALLLVIALSLPSVARAHGTQGKAEEGVEAICASFAYDDGSAMSYSAVKVFSPVDQKMPFQTGKADRNGYFCFRPDAAGRWKLTAEDEDGHQVRLSTSVKR